MTPIIPYFYVKEIPLAAGVTLNVPGALLAIGLIAGSVAALRKARRNGLQVSLLAGVLPWLFAALLIGGHIGEVLFYRPAAFAQDPKIIFNIWEGQACFGGFILCVIAWIAYFRCRLPKGDAQHSLASNHWAYADCVAYGTALGWFFGRMGCVVIHSYPGTESRFWLAVYGICPGTDAGIACHDLSLYEAALSLCMFMLFVSLDRKRRFPGYFVALLAILYGFSRLLLDDLRQPLMDMRYLGLTPAQLGSIFMLCYGSWMLLRRRAQTGTNATTLGRRKAQSGE
jgi:phosphatidylglycerol:prolipoprotein diacylglycerol transferase